MDMGMTDRQFNGFLRFLLDSLNGAMEETDAEKREAKLNKVIDNIQKTIED